MEIEESEDTMVLIEEDPEAPKPAEKKLSRNDFIIEQLLGEGAHAKVYKIRMKDT